MVLDLASLQRTHRLHNFYHSIPSTTMNVDFTGSTRNICDTQLAIIEIIESRFGAEKVFSYGLEEKNIMRVKVKMKSANDPLKL